MTKMNEPHKDSQISNLTDYFKDLKPDSGLKGEVQRQGYTLKLSSNDDSVEFSVHAGINGNIISVRGTAVRFGAHASIELTFANPTNELELDCYSPSRSYSCVRIYDKDGKELHAARADGDTFVKYSGAGIHRAVYEGSVEASDVSMRLTSVTHGFAKIKGS
ncbi:hypothetical protein ACPZMI_04395 [Pseudomonas wayambapalatensis]|uniref:hypothetical protein n=1 Tax=Pseudomonas wayambapalatensis TaxID=485895 RepID=UPI003CF50B54